MDVELMHQPTAPYRVTGRDVACTRSVLDRAFAVSPSTSLRASVFLPKDWYQRWAWYYQAGAHLGTTL